MDYVGDSEKGAYFSEDRLHRYTLWRRWSTGSKLLPFCGLNPSTADETQNDPTVSRCINYAKKWGYDGMVMLNIFAYRATDPRDMKSFREPIGHLNDAVLLSVAKDLRSVVCCWGAHGSFMNRESRVIDVLSQSGCDLLCLGVTKDGHPKHPLYLRGDLSPISLLHKQRR